MTISPDSPTELSTQSRLRMRAKAGESLQMLLLKINISRYTTVVPISAFQDPLYTEISYQDTLMLVM